VSFLGGEGLQDEQVERALDERRILLSQKRSPLSTADRSIMLFYRPSIGDSPLLP